MWLKCGTKPSATSRKEWLKHWNCGDCCSAQYLALVLTMNGGGPYNLVIRRAVRLRRDCAPLKLLTYVWTEPPRRSRRFKFRRLLGSLREVGNRKVSGLFDK